MTMHVQPVVNELRAALTSHAALAGGDPAIDAAIQHLIAALDPAVRQAAMDLAQQAAAEVGAQLDDRAVDVVLVDGDPTLRVGDAPSSGSQPSAAEDFDARITLRLPPSLKRLVEDSATIDGDSVNAWVVDALSRRANRSSRTSERRVTESFDL
jgi:hypothetical protein